MGKNSKRKFDLFYNLWVKYISMTLLPVFISLGGSWWFSSTKYKIPAGVLTIILLVLLIVALFFYWKQEKRMEAGQSQRLKKVNEELNIKIAAVTAALNAVKDRIANCANTLYTDVKKKTQEHCEIQNWDWVKAECENICRGLYELVEKLAVRGDNFSVNIIFKKTQDGKSGFTMLARKATSPHAPAMYDSFFTEEEVKGYHYQKLFDEAPTRPEFLANKADIEKAFKNRGNINYSQYIAIPVACPGNRMIALLQIVAYDDSKLAKNKKGLEELYNKYFCAFSSLILLSDKVENIGGALQREQEK